jgi:ADP-ribosylglycohydrolase
MVDLAPDLRDRILGCFLGGAIGDALGGPIEFLSLERAWSAVAMRRWGLRIGAK